MSGQRLLHADRLREAFGFSEHLLSLLAALLNLCAGPLLYVVSRHIGLLRSADGMLDREALTKLPRN